MAQKLKIAGIDFGSKMAGTTAFAYIHENNQFELFQSQKNQDADEMLINLITTYQPDLIALDAPLSLPPGITSGNLNDDFFYRFADKKLKAMSPMFLGGLTARAMKLASYCKYKKIELIESYPAAFIQSESLQHIYQKKDLNLVHDFINQTQKNFSFQVPALNNWHAIDACICLEIGIRKSLSIARSIGDADGIIWY